jgi:hypothetical protein
MGIYVLHTTDEFHSNTNFIFVHSMIALSVQQVPRITARRLIRLDRDYSWCVARTWDHPAVIQSLSVNPCAVIMKRWKKTDCSSVYIAESEDNVCDFSSIVSVHHFRDSRYGKTLPYTTPFKLGSTESA